MSEVATPAHQAGETSAAELDARRDSVFRACVAALQMQGYAIEVLQPEAGLIVTRPKQVEGAARSGGSRPLFRTYVVEVREGTEGPGRKVHVVATTARSGPNRAPVPSNLRQPAWEPAEEREEQERFWDDVRALVERERDNMLSRQHPTAK